MTPIDKTHDAMMASPDDEQARMGFYNCFASAELFLALEEEPTGETLKPMTFPIDEGSFVVAFDVEERLADFAGAPVPYISMSGRALSDMLKTQDIGVALNIGALSEQVLTPDTLAWLNGVLSEAPKLAEALPTDLMPPSNLPESLIAALDLKLASMAGMSRCAYLAKATYKDGTSAHIIAFLDAPILMEEAIAQSVSETLAFSGLEAGQLDVMFINATDPIAAKFAKTALRFDLPELAEPHVQQVPGSDPDRPPKLR